MSRTGLRVNLHSIVCLIVKEPLAQSGRHIRSLSDRNGVRTYNHLFPKRRFNHIDQLVKRLNCVVSTYLHDAFNCMYYCATYEIESESTLYSLSECHRTTCSKHAPYLKYIGQQWDLISTQKTS